MRCSWLHPSHDALRSLFASAKLAPRDRRQELKAASNYSGCGTGNEKGTVHRSCCYWCCSLFVCLFSFFLEFHLEKNGDKDTIIFRYSVDGNNYYLAISKSGKVKLRVSYVQQFWVFLFFYFLGIFNLSRFGAIFYFLLGSNNTHSSFIVFI